MLKRILFVIALNAFLGIINAQNPLKITIKSGNYDREYLLYTPKNYGKNNPADLIVCLHGFNRTMEDFFSNYNISQVADSLNMIVLAPQALPEQDTQVIQTAKTIKTLFGYDIPLDAAWGCGLRVTASLGSLTLMNEELNKPVDDAAFINEIITKTLSDYSVRSQNQFVFGTSMGGFMSYQYALKYGNSLSGLISVCGSMGTSIKNTDAQVSVPICDFHSLTDEVVPYTGEMNQSGLTISLCRSKPFVVKFWVEKNGASLVPQEEDVHYYPSDNGKTVKKFTYSHLENEVIHYQINGADHSYYFRKENGDCMDYNEEIYKFIHAHISGSDTGIEYPVTEIVNIYPNPVRDIVRITVPEGRAIVYDRGGRMVLDRSFTSGRLDVSSLDKGMYILRIYSHGVVRTCKLIKI